FNIHNHHCIRKYENGTLQENFFYIHDGTNEVNVLDVKRSFAVFHNFISEEEETNLTNEIEPHVKRLKYEFNHWDDAIHGYRETEKSKWSTKCFPILERVKKISFEDSENLIPHVHILDLSPDGVIKPHIDSIRFCGDTISGLCLLSDAVMRLVKDQENNQVVDVLLPRRALYIMKDDSRYKYTHEILGKESSYFGSLFIKRERRVSVIIRNPP
ncbi:Alpha-ketoglutarate-dependent dioxygenase alkB-like protein 7, mitochondrial, partial [Armadillidium nasatum]